MPYTPPKARMLLKEGKARPKSNKLGLFYLQLPYTQELEKQLLVVGIDPESLFEGYSVVGTGETVLNLMAEAPHHVKDAVETRRTRRCARRFRKWRRPCQSRNRLTRKKRIPPSTRSRWQAKARVVKYLTSILPLMCAVVEDVQAITNKGKEWKQAFSPVQVGKMHLHRLLSERGSEVQIHEGWQSKERRDHYGLPKAKSTFASHAVDTWALAANVSRASNPTCTSLWNGASARLDRRQLHALQPAKGGVRRPYRGARSRGLKRGTLVKHPTYGLCIVGGCDRKKKTSSLHGYRMNMRLTQGVKVDVCQVLTWVAFRSRWVA